MSERITRELYAPLIGRRILIGLTASSAIYRSIDLIRRLRRLGAEIRVVMTRESLEYLGVKLVEWASGYKPYIELTGRTEHIELAEWADALIIAPATIKTLASIINGILDQLLYLVTAAMMGMGKRIMVVPTMNLSLYKSPQYRVIRERLRDLGVNVVEPLIEEDKAKYPPLDDLVHCIDTYINRGRDLEDAKILVTAGATIEHLDPVRVITNPSSGLMGILIAREAMCRGAHVDLVTGLTRYNPPYNVNVYRVETTGEMYQVVRRLSIDKRYDAAVFAAAPADYKPTIRSSVKIPSREYKRLEIRLQEAAKVVKAVPRSNRPRVKVVFAAETVNDHIELLEKARAKYEEYDADMVVANIIGRGKGFGSEFIDACIISDNKHLCYGTVRKEIIARKIIDYIADMIRGAGSGG